MQAWIVDRPGPIDSGPLRFVEMPEPEPKDDELLVRVAVCGVCRTDLHLAEGDLPPRRHGVVPGHEVVGTVEGVGLGVSRFSIGDRVGIAWLRGTDGTCRFCRRGMENLCRSPVFTGWDVNGGYAEWAVVPEAFAYAIPERFSDEQAAPLLCAGIIGYRALRRAALPPGGRLGIYGFGGSAHLAAQVAIHEGATVHVMTRSAADQALARELGVASVQGSDAAPPEPLDSAILFAPVGTLVPPALAALDRGGTLSVAGIYLSDVPSLNYERELFYEKNLVSVTANTRADGEEFLKIAAAIEMRVHVNLYPFERADAALSDLAHDAFNGAAVLEVAKGSNT
ncbi:MAG TPA: zinc-dependent alcohol dehydrogenase family protein [Acidimicrobiales bacterium]|nr:zinc-dependent alcohol dehydrogenase family protein [Acidimicrobiales bacterium]